ncbi:hypothetical protein [Oceaniradius stylonematis]|uniref:hypothetical protein n=1 Tax=Oceaniradius stylonematis TaxID=2184161 RepID=UPI0035CF1F0B
MRDEPASEHAQPPLASLLEKIALINGLSVKPAENCFEGCVVERLRQDYIVEFEDLENTAVPGTFRLAGKAHCTLIVSMM